MKIKNDKNVLALTKLYVNWRFGADNKVRRPQ